MMLDIGVIKYVTSSIMHVAPSIGLTIWILMLFRDSAQLLCATNKIIIEFAALANSLANARPLRKKCGTNKIAATPKVINYAHKA